MITTYPRLTVRAFLLVCAWILCVVPLSAEEITHLQGEMAGEVTMGGAILQSRLTSGDS